MHQFETLTYLDVQKTGSSFVSQFLSKHMRERDAGLRKHAPVANRQARMFYLVSVRDPLQQYISLFRYGAGGHGSLRAFIDAQGQGALYDSVPHGPVAALERWLDFVLRPRHTAILGEGYHLSCPDLIGFQTFRFLMLALPDARARLATAERRLDVRRLYRAEGLPDAVIRTEHLREDLDALIDGPLAPRLHDATAARHNLRDIAPVNVSRIAPELRNTAISPELAARVRAREWLLYEQFYADPARSADNA